jgi:hypothetical protein
MLTSVDQVMIGRSLHICGAKLIVFIDLFVRYGSPGANRGLQGCVGVIAVGIGIMTVYSTAFTGFSR